MGTLTQLGYTISIVWLVIFLIILQSLTGILIFVMVTPVVLLIWAHRTQGFGVKIGTYLMFLAIIAFSGVYVMRCISEFKIPEVDIDQLPKTTANGNPYQHNIEIQTLENGNLIWLYVSDAELKKAWNDRSTLDYNGYDKKGQSLRTTLIRYLTSLGYTKDSAGVANLSDKDIAMVENGFANYIYSKKFSIYPRLYQIVWEIDVYKKTGNPSGHSFTQRIEYLKTAFQIIRNHFWIGVGTGDLDDAYKTQYEIMNTPLSKEWQHRAHNQLATFYVTFGILGFLWVLFSLVTAPLLENKFRNLYFLMFFIIVILSMLNEDTLETHAGISFFSFFLSFFLFSVPNSEDLKW
jgi:hypothetical protein